MRVWAPKANRMEVEWGGERHAMRQVAGHHWVLDVRLPPDTDYMLIMDGDKRFPDPRSPRQPNGVHQASRSVDHESFPWGDQGWRPPSIREAVVYELHIGTFTPAGTFAGVAEKLDDLRELGVTHVEIMPVASFPGRWGWGYDGVYPFAPQENYGGPDGLKRLVDACHARGIGVILDVVYNHFGPEGCYLQQFGPYFTSKYRTPWGDAVNMDDGGCDEVRRYLCDSALQYLRDYHMDGLRLDAVHAIVDTSAVPFLEQLAREVAALSGDLGRPLVLIAESDLNDPRIIQSWDQGGYGLDLQWSDDFHHALHAALTGERRGYYADFGSMSDIAKALREVFVYGDRYSPFRDRHHGRAPTGIPGDRFVTCLQNHDQIGNRARGERIGEMIGVGLEKAGAALLLTAPYVPLLFQGQEWGASSPFPYFADFEDETLRESIRRGRVEEFAHFGWDPQALPDPLSEETFKRAVLRWDEQTTEPHRSLFAWYRDLIHLRRAHPELARARREDLEVRFDENERWLCFTSGRFTIVVNLGAEERRVPLFTSRTVELLLASEPEATVERSAAGLPRLIRMPPESAAVLHAKG